MSVNTSERRAEAMITLSRWGKQVRMVRGSIKYLLFRCLSSLESDLDSFSLLLTLSCADPFLLTSELEDASCCGASCETLSAVRMRDHKKIVE